MSPIPITPPKPLPIIIPFSLAPNVPPTAASRKRSRPSDTSASATPASWNFPRPKEFTTEAGELAIMVHNYLSRSNINPFKPGLDVKDLARGHGTPFEYMATRLGNLASLPAPERTASIWRFSMELLASGFGLLADLSQNKASEERDYLIGRLIEHLKSYQSKVIEAARNPVESTVGELLKHSNSFVPNIKHLTPQSQVNAVLQQLTHLNTRPLDPNAPVLPGRIMEILASTDGTSEAAQFVAWSNKQLAHFSEVIRRSKPADRQLQPHQVYVNVPSPSEAPPIASLSVSSSSLSSASSSSSSSSSVAKLTPKHLTTIQKWAASRQLSVNTSNLGSSLRDWTPNSRAAVALTPNRGNANAIAVTTYNGSSTKRPKVDTTQLSPPSPTLIGMQELHRMSLLTNTSKAMIQDHAFAERNVAPAAFDNLQFHVGVTAPQHFLGAKIQPPKKIKPPQSKKSPNRAANKK
jgi:hypothetical protein